MRSTVRRKHISGLWPGVRANPQGPLLKHISLNGLFPNHFAKVLERQGLPTRLGLSYRRVERIYEAAFGSGKRSLQLG